MVLMHSFSAPAQIMFPAKAGASAHPVLANRFAPLQAPLRPEKGDVTDLTYSPLRPVKMVMSPT
jgi:hypothetical protein